MRGLTASKPFKLLALLGILLCLAMAPFAVSTAADLPDKPPVFANDQAAMNYYIGLVDQLDVTTGISKSVFYSGAGNRKLAEQFAVAENKMTLEMTPGGKFLDDLKLFEQGSPLKPEQATKVWSRLSRRYADQAAGDVFCFVIGARPTGVFTTVELPELRKNRKVGNIYHVSRL